MISSGPLSVHSRRAFPVVYMFFSVGVNLKQINQVNITNCKKKKLKIADTITGKSNLNSLMV